MFILASKYDEVVLKLGALVHRYNVLSEQWNDLVARVNAKGGESFLRSEPMQFSAEEIRTLIVLCHPDKHAGSKAAHEMTTKLLSMRSKRLAAEPSHRSDL